MTGQFHLLAFIAVTGSVHGNEFFGERRHLLAEIQEMGVESVTGDRARSPKMEYIAEWGARRTILGTFGNQSLRPHLNSYDALETAWSRTLASDYRPRLPCFYG